MHHPLRKPSSNWLVVTHKHAHCLCACQRLRVVKCVYICLSAQWTTDLSLPGLSSLVCPPENGTAWTPAAQACGKSGSDYGISLQMIVVNGVPALFFQDLTTANLMFIRALNAQVSSQKLSQVPCPMSPGIGNGVGAGAGAGFGA